MGWWRILCLPLSCALQPIEASVTAVVQDEAESEDYEMIRDPAFLLYVLENLPGVDPQSETVRNALGELTQGDTAKKDKDGQNKDK